MWMIDDTNRGMELYPGRRRTGLVVSGTGRRVSRLVVSRLRGTGYREGSRRVEGYRHAEHANLGDSSGRTQGTQATNGETVMWKWMLERLRHPPTDEELKAAARRETDRLKAELARQGIRFEMATHHTINNLEHELRRTYQERSNDRT